MLASVPLPGKVGDLEDPKSSSGRVLSYSSCAKLHQKYNVLPVFFIGIKELCIALAEQFLIGSESRRKFHKLRLDVLSIPNYVIKKGPIHGGQGHGVAQGMRTTGGGGLVRVPNLRVCKDSCSVEWHTQEVRNELTSCRGAVQSAWQETSSETQRRKSRATPKGLASGRPGEIFLRPLTSSRAHACVENYKRLFLNMTQMVFRRKHSSVFRSLREFFALFLLLRAFTKTSARKCAIQLWFIRSRN